MENLNQFELKDIIEKYKLTAFIETCTTKMDSLFYAAKHEFLKCYSIKMNDALYQKASRIFNSDYIKIIHGESVGSLKKIIRSYNDSPILFYLGPQFISDELKIIKKYRKYNNDVIIIYDLKLVDNSDQKNTLPEGIKGIPEAMESYNKLFKQSHKCINIQKDEGCLALLPKELYKSETAKVRDIVLPYIKNAKKITDIGFGGDKIIPSAIGIDYESPYAYTGYDKVDIACDVSQGIPVENNCFDCVYSSHLIEDFEDTESILREFIRILTPGGILALVVPNEKIYRKHCIAINQPYNTHHKIKDMDANYLEKILSNMELKYNVLCKENEIIDYNSILIVQIN